MCARGWLCHRLVGGEGWRVARLHAPCLRYSKAMLLLYLTQIILQYIIVFWPIMTWECLFSSHSDLAHLPCFMRSIHIQNYSELVLMTLKSLSSKISWWGEGVAEVVVALLWQLPPLLSNIYIQVTKRAWIKNSWSVHCPSHLAFVMHQASNIVTGYL